MKITLYSNNCPRCEHLASLLTAESIPYYHVTDVDLMLQRGFKTVPMLEVEGQIIDYPAALAWLNERKDTHANHQV